MMEYGDLGIKTGEDVLSALRAGASAYGLHGSYGERISGLIADAADLQRSELEALRAELAETARGALLYRDAMLALKKENAELRAENEATANNACHQRERAKAAERERGALRTDLADLELERQVVASERETLRARVKELEGALDNARREMSGADPEGFWDAIERARAALESGGPIDPIGPIEKPIAPAPKTFTAVEIEELLNAAEMRANDTTPGMHVGEEFLVSFRIEIRRALGLGEP